MAFQREEIRWTQKALAAHTASVANPANAAAPAKYIHQVTKAQPSGNRDPTEPPPQGL